MKRLVSIISAVLLVVLVILPMSAVYAGGGQGQSGTTLSAGVTATGRCTSIQPYDWSIVKSVTNPAPPGALEIGPGETGEATCTVQVTRTAGTPSGGACGVSGTVTVTNGGAVATESLVISLDVLYQSGGGPYQTLTSSAVSVSGNPVLDPDETGIYPFNVTFTPVAGASYKVSANVTITNHSGHLGEDFGPSPDSGFSLGSPATTYQDATATLTQDIVDPITGFEITSDFAPQNFSDSGSYSFKVFYKNVSAVSGNYTGRDTATLVEDDTKAERTGSATVDIKQKMTLPRPEIELEKSGPAEACVGDRITYTFKVTNTGGVPLGKVKLTDVRLGLSNVVIADNLGGPGQSVTFQKTYTVRAGDAPTLTNTATAKARYAATRTWVTDDDGHEVKVTARPCPKPEIHLEKSAPAEACVGDTITYTFTATNTGGADLTNVRLTDLRLGIFNRKIADSLPVGGQVTFTQDYTIKASDPDTIKNEACVTAWHCLKMLSDKDRHEVKVGKPSILFLKGGPLIACAGCTITYWLNTYNTGNTWLYDVTVKDEMLGVDVNIGDLPPRGSYCFPVTYTVKDTDPDPLKNHASAVADTPCGRRLESKACWSVCILKPAIEITKTADKSGACEGEKVTYTVKVKNTGNTFLWRVKVKDALLGLDETIPLLAPGCEKTYTGEYTVPDGGPDDPIVNTATAKGFSFVCWKWVNDEASWSVDVLKPGIKITKGADKDAACVGETVTYSYLVENTGDLELHDIRVKDDVAGDVNDTALTLAAGASTTLYKEYVIKAGDPKPLVNTATVEGTSPCDRKVKDESSFEVDTLHPGIKITKSGPASAVRGSTVTYEFLVENTGDIDITDIVVIDDVLGVINTVPFDLAAGGSQSLSKSYTVQPTDSSPLVNVATATGQGHCGPVTDDDDHSLTITEQPLVLPRAEIKITKTLNDSDGEVKVGDTYSYNIKVENTGRTFIPADVRLTDTYDGAYQSYQFADPASDDNVDDGEVAWSDITGGEGLKPGAYVVVTAYFTAVKAGDTENRVTVNAYDENETPLTGESSDDVTIVERPTAPAPAPEVVQPAPAPARPETVAQVTPAAPAAAELPYTGDNLGLFLMLGWILVLGGSVLLGGHVIQRRMRRVRVFR